MSNNSAKTTGQDGMNRAKAYQLVLFPLNNGATNVYFVLVLSYIAMFGNGVLGLLMAFATIMVTAMRLCDAITDPIIGALIDRTSGKFGKFRPFMIIGNLVMAASVLVLYLFTPLIPESMMWLRYVLFVLLYFIWVIGYTFQTSCTRSGQTVLTNDPKQRPMFTLFNTVGSLIGMGAMQFLAPIIRSNVGDYNTAEFYRVLAPLGIVISIVLTILAVIGIWEKDQPKYYGIGGANAEKVKVSELFWRQGDPAFNLSLMGENGLSINLYTILFIVFFGIGYGAYYSTADMPIPMVADCSDYETYRSGKYIPGIMGTLFSLVDKLVSSLATTVVAIAVSFIGLSDLPAAETPYAPGMNWVVIVLFCIIPMLAWIATLIAMKGYTLTGPKMKEIQAVNAARKAAIADGKTMEQAMKMYQTIDQVPAEFKS